MLGDSSACGLGVHHPHQTPGAMLAAGLAECADRPVELTGIGAVGARSSDLSAQIERVAGATFDVAVIMIGANDVTHRVKPPTAVRHLDHAVRRLRRARRPGRRRHLSRPRHRRAGPPAAALDRPTVEPAARSGADDRRRRGRRAHRVARRHPGPGVRRVAEGDVRPGPLPPFRGRLRQRRCGDAALGVRRPGRLVRRPGRAAPRTSAAARASGRSRWRLSRPPTRPAPRSPPRRSAGRDRGPARPLGAAPSPAGRQQRGGAGHRRAGRTAALASIPTTSLAGAHEAAEAPKNSATCVHESAAPHPGGPRARGSDRRNRAQPDRPRLQGLAGRRPAGRPGGHRRAGRAGQGARARPGHARRPDARLCRAGGQAGREHGPPGRGRARATTRCRAPR